ncbi:MAG: hypothetical protein HQM10_06685 [Candidatus Riflebacteria bacterium]|nr:hypothetical protein [Candidatus Riflebacteria bacterium]
MKIRTQFFLLMMLMFSLVGCGGGGGGGGSIDDSGGSVIDDILANPNTIIRTASLVDSGAASDLGMTSGKPNVVKLQSVVPNSKYGIVFSTLTTLKGKYRVLGNGGGGKTLASIMSVSENDSVLTDNFFPSQSSADQEMFLKRQSLLNNPDARLNTSRRLSTLASLEKVGDEVEFWAYSKSVSGGGDQYTKRKGILRRIGEYCKIFVDPDSYNDLSAVSGQYKITDEDLNDLQSKFDSTIYPLLTSDYAQPLDVDNDGKLTIFFSPMYSRLGFAGLFDTLHLEGGAQSNNRDMFVIFTPYSQFNGIEWRKVALETISHEFQHLVNFSYRHSKGFQSEEVWLDEALSVGVEARYRILTGDRAGEDRFNDYIKTVKNTALTGFSWDLRYYGAAGLFAHYLYERGGGASIRKLVQTDSVGLNNVNQVFSAYGGFYRMFQDWSVALFCESHKKLISNIEKVTSINKYHVDMGFNLASTTTRISPNEKFEASISENAMAFLILEIPSNWPSSEVVIAYESPDTASLSCSVMKLQ